MNKTVPPADETRPHPRKRRLAVPKARVFGPPPGQRTRIERLEVGELVVTSPGTKGSLRIGFDEDTGTIALTMGDATHGMRVFIGEHVWNGRSKGDWFIGLVDQGRVMRGAKGRLRAALVNRGDGFACVELNDREQRVVFREVAPAGPAGETGDAFASGLARRLSRAPRQKAGGDA